MRLPELLGVGVVPPPLPYFPPPYLPELLVGVGLWTEVVVPPVDGTDPVVLLPHAVKRMTSIVLMSPKYQLRIVGFELERLFCIIYILLSPLKEYFNVIMLFHKLVINTYGSYKSNRAAHYEDGFEIVKKVNFSTSIKLYCLSSAITSVSTPDRLILSDFKSFRVGACCYQID